MTYTVKQLASIAGVSPRTLHYYDEIGLLAPTALGANGYRHYEEAALLRLQQILFYKELGLELKEIGKIVNRPDFDVMAALHAHKTALHREADRLQTLIRTVDKTILHLKGEHTMNDKDLFEGWSEEKQEEYLEEARQRWDPRLVDQSERRWKSFSQEKKDAIRAEGGQIMLALSESMEKDPSSPEAQAQIDAYFKYVNKYFYDLTLEILRGLGEMWVADPRFKATYENIRPGLAEFARQAVAHYCDTH